MAAEFQIEKWHEIVEYLSKYGHTVQEEMTRVAYVLIRNKDLERKKKEGRVYQLIK